jgi:hypothetical protein
LIDEIELAYVRGTPLTIGSLQEYFRTHFRSAMNKTTLAHMLARDPHIRRCPGIPTESGRLEVTLGQIEVLFRDAIQTIEGVPIHFVFKMDEMGHQELADRKIRTCVVPSSHAEDYVNVPVRRTGNWIIPASIVFSSQQIGRF